MTADTRPPLTAGQQQVLLTVCRSTHEMRVGEIVAELGQTYATVSRTAQKLERMGLVIRHVPTCNRRRTHVVATPAGHSFLAGMGGGGG